MARLLIAGVDNYVPVGPFFEVANGYKCLASLTATNDVATVVCSHHDNSTTCTHTSGTCSTTAGDDWGLIDAASGHGSGMFQLKIPAASIPATGGSAVLTIVDEDVHIPVFHEFEIVNANWMDSTRGTDLLDVSTVQWTGTAVHAATVAGVPVVQLHATETSAGIDAPNYFEHLSITDTTGLVAVPTTQKVDVETIKTQAVTCGAGVTIRADVGAAAAPGAGNGMLIGGSNAATTFATLTSTGALTAGSTSLGAVTATTITPSGTVAIGGALTVAGVTTLTGAVTCSSTVATGAVTKASETITAALTTGSIVNGGVFNQTGAVTLTAGINAGTISGTLANDIITAASINTGAFTADAFAANAIEAAAIKDGAITNAKVADDVDVNAKTITAGAIANATFAADVGSTAYATNIIALAVQKSVEQNKLDHLVAVADADDVVNDSIMAKLAATAGDWSTFSDSTDSLQSLRDRGDAAWITATGFSTHSAADVKTAMEAAGGYLALTKTAAEAVDVLTKAAGGGDLAAIFKGVVTDATGLNVAVDVVALRAVCDLIEDIVRNQLEITDATGAVVLRADNNVAALFTVPACVTDDATTTIRKRLE